MKQPTAGELVLQVLSVSGWLAPFEIREIILRDSGRMFQESGITARIRELKYPAFGSHPIVSRRRKGSRAYEYKLS